MTGYIIAGVIALLVGLAAGIAVGYYLRRSRAEAAIGSAEDQAKKILEDAIKSAESKKKEILLEAKEEILKTKNEADREIKDRRVELSRQERRVVAKEESLDRKIEAIEKKEDLLNGKLKNADEMREDVARLKKEEEATLQKISGMTVEQAKDLLLTTLDGELTHEKAMKMMEIEEQFKEDVDEKAREILSLAIQRCAAEQVAEVTVSSIQLPSDDMKGRIIGREGRNIRALENLIGVDLIIDDTPETITISCFDPMRREVARIALEKLIQDGRIHPTRIEEMVDRARREVDAAVKQAGERATFETGVHGFPQDMIRLLGRLKYRTSYGQNVLRHSIEVSLLSGMLADELGADSITAKRAGLLHDIGKALTQEVEGSHVQLGVEVARKHKESAEIIHAIEAHHGDVEAKSIIAVIVQAADAISAARPGARRENLENYIKRLTKLEEIANSFDCVEKSFAIQAGREIRIMVKPEAVDDDTMILVAHDIVKRIENELEYPGQIKVNVIRESRAIDYAK